MKKSNLFRKISAAVMAGLLMAAAVFPSSAALTKHENPGNPNTAKITAGKTVTSSTSDSTGQYLYPTELPDNAFQFKLEPISYTDRAGVTTDEGAVPVGAAAGTPAVTLPMPDGAGYAAAAGADPRSYTVQVGGATDPFEATSPAAPTAPAVAGQQTKETAFPDIDFNDKAKDAPEGSAFPAPGVYTYKLTEIESTPTAAISGVDYDKAVYFVNVYVGNALYSDGTPVLRADGTAQVTVTQISAYKNTNTTVLDPNEPDNGGEAPITNDTTDREQEGKVGTGTQDPDPDKHSVNIKYPFENIYSTTSYTVSKSVTGTLADPNAYFPFTSTLYNADGKTTNEISSLTYQVRTQGADASDPDDDGYVNIGADGMIGTEDDVTLTKTEYDGLEQTAKDALVYTTGAMTDGEFKYNLKHDQYIAFINIPIGNHVKVVETDNTGYQTKIEIQHGIAPDAQPDPAKGEYEEGNNRTDTGVIELAALETDPEKPAVKNSFDFTNNKQHTPPTGVVLTILPFALILLGAGFGLFFLIGKPKKRR